MSQFWRSNSCQDNKFDISGFEEVYNDDQGYSADENPTYYLDE